MPFGLIQFLPTRPSLGLQAFLIGREKPLCGFSYALQDEKGLFLRASTRAIPFAILLPAFHKS